MSDDTDPTICNICGGTMKPLFIGFYCPNNCDKPELQTAQSAIKVDPDDTQPLPAPSWAPPPSPIVAPLINRIRGKYAIGNAVPVVTPDDECPDFFCNGKGVKTHVTYIGTKVQHWYSCTLCNKSWSINSVVSHINNIKKVVN